MVVLGFVLYKQAQIINTFLGSHMDLGPKVWRPKYVKGLGFEVYKYDIYKKP